MAGPKPRSYEDALKAFDSVPLFMRELPEGKIDESSDVALSALQSLVHEGPPDGG